jgi:hypothetical protein
MTRTLRPANHRAFWPRFAGPDVLQGRDSTWSALPHVG